ncbi:MAG: hypothetical protein KC489_09345, partial [Gemmatimonadetes bacterium]|nr:hypothetical protein [Gemmatimonadota bacterium]
MTCEGVGGPPLEYSQTRLPGALVKPLHVLACLALLAACRGDAPAAQQLEQAELEALVDTLMPQVAEAAGLEFRTRPAVAVRSKEQVRTFLLAKL